MDRIGRDRTPAERSLANARERPEAAEYHGRCLYEYETGGRWSKLPKLKQRKWVDRALAMLEQHVEDTTDDDPPDPDGGLPFPIEGAA